MNGIVRRKLDMATRVREFTRAHVDADPGYQPVLTRLEELLTHAEATSARQTQGRVVAKAAKQRRMELRRDLQSQLMHYVVGLGSFAVKGQTQVSAQFKLPDANATNRVFLSSVKAILATAQSQQDILAKQGLVLASLDEIARMVTEFEDVSEAALTARRDVIGAGADLADLTARMMEQANLLDAITRYRFGKDTDVTAQWKAARHIKGLQTEEPTPPAAQSDAAKRAA